MMYVYKKARDANQLFCLGCGGLATTFDGFKIDGRDRIPVAIKQVSLDRRAAERFEQLHFRGLQTMQGRSHAGIVKFMGFFKGDDGDGKIRLSFVFERCPMAKAFLVDAEPRGGFILPIESRLAQGTTEGCDLTSNPLKMPPYTPSEALFVTRQLLQSLVYLHSALPPIIHRDVKPDNVLIWAAERRPIVMKKDGMPGASSNGTAAGAEVAGSSSSSSSPSGAAHAASSTAASNVTAAITSASNGLPHIHAPSNSVSASADDGASGDYETFLTVKLTDYDTVRRYDTSDLTVGSGTRPFMAPEVDVQTGTVPNSMPIGGGGGGGNRPTGPMKGPSPAAGAGGGGGPPDGKAVGRYGPSVDIFSVGATLFFLITGHAPSPDLRAADWRVRFLGDTRYEADKEQAFHAAVAQKAKSGGGGGGGQQQLAPVFRVPSAGLGLGAAAAKSSAAAGGSGGGDAQDSLWGSSAPGTPTTVNGAAGLFGGLSLSGGGAKHKPSTTPAPAPVESILDHFFPPNSPLRAYLKGLVYRCPESAGQEARRWSASEAIATLDKWFPEVAALAAAPSGTMR